MKRHPDSTKLPKEGGDVVSLRESIARSARSVAARPVDRRGPVIVTDDDLKPWLAKPTTTD